MTVQWSLLCNEMLYYYLQISRGKTVKILTQGGEMLELCYELRTPFVMSVAANQVCAYRFFNEYNSSFILVNVYA